MTVTLSATAAIAEKYGLPTLFRVWWTRLIMMCCLLPARRHYASITDMFAPVKQAPFLRVPLTHGYLAAIGGLTLAGQLFLQTQNHHSSDGGRRHILATRSTSSLVMAG